MINKEEEAVWYSVMGRDVAETGLPEHFGTAVALLVPWPTAFTWIS